MIGRLLRRRSDPLRRWRRRIEDFENLSIHCRHMSRRGSSSSSSRIVLGIETSCDDTAVAIVSSEGEILSNVVASQWDLQSEYKGIHPMMSSREHEKNLPHVIERAVDESGIGEVGNVDAVAVTSGPGLALCLQIGLDAAKEICLEHDLPLYPIHHIEAHTLVPRIENTVQFPFLALITSGGHTLLVHVESHGVYRRLGTTVDDAAGEAFDKVARMLRLTDSFVGHGGVALQNAALNGNASQCPARLPVPLRRNPKHSKTCDFSFSGLKTAVLYAIREYDESTFFQDTSMVNDFAASFQDVAVQHLVDRTRKAIELCERENLDMSCLVVSGGVAANTLLRERLSDLTSNHDLNLAFPPLSLCTDNGVMIAWAAHEAIRSSSPPSALISKDEISALQISPRWPFGI